MDLHDGISYTGKMTLYTLNRGPVVDEVFSL